MVHINLHQFLPHYNMNDIEFKDSFNNGNHQHSLSVLNTSTYSCTETDNGVDLSEPCVPLT